LVDELTSTLVGDSRTVLLSKVIALFSPLVVKALPPYFHGITSLEQAEAWFVKMTSDSRLLTVSSKDTNELLGFVFLSLSTNNTAHIGYLLGEQYWGKGYAKECLGGLIDWCLAGAAIKVLIGGVEKGNVASAKLLEGLGFTPHFDEVSPVVFYEYQLS
jgi:RimJ/RimL family protein N-acetyltransferase